MWKPNPTELVGIWELVDIAGQGSLSPIMTSTGASFAGMIEGVRLEKIREEKSREPLRELLHLYVCRSSSTALTLSVYLSICL